MHGTILRYDTRAEASVVRVWPDRVYRESLIVTVRSLHGDEKMPEKIMYSPVIYLLIRVRCRDHGRAANRLESASTLTWKAGSGATYQAVPCGRTRSILLQSLSGISMLSRTVQMPLVTLSRREPCGQFRVTLRRTLQPVSEVPFRGIGEDTFWSYFVWCCCSCDHDADRTNDLREC